jgi:hypothetical protein
MHHSVPVSDRIDSPLGFSGKQRLHSIPDNSCGKTHMMKERCMTQTELAECWRISEATLERWRTESNGPMFLKLGNQVRYRVQDVEAFEEVALRGSTKIDGAVEQPVIPAQRPPSIPVVTKSKLRPITIWLRTGARSTRLRPFPAARTLPR